MDFSQIVKRSQEASADAYMGLLDEAIGVLSGQVETDELIATTTTPPNVERLVELDPFGNALVVGDLHGDIESLSTIMEQSGFLKSLQPYSDDHIIFLGDYVDRGEQSAAVYYAVLSLKIAYPKQIILLQGNHEGPIDLQPSPHDLPLFLQRRFGEKWVPIYQKIRQSFSYLSTAVYVAGRYLMVHGGLPAKIHSLEEIAQASQKHPEKPFLEDLLWNDPDDSVLGVSASPRGAGNLFGKSITDLVLQRLDAKILIRGHEPVPKGYKINHDGKVLTLFSSKGPPYFNRFGAYLQIPLDDMFGNSSELLPYIHQF